MLFGFSQKSIQYVSVSGKKNGHACHNVSILIYPNSWLVNYDLGQGLTFFPLKFICKILQRAARMTNIFLAQVCPAQFNT